MWPTRIQNPTFLLKIYGCCPDLGGVEIVSTSLSHGGPQLSINLITTTLPAKPPIKWGSFNRVAITLRCFPLKSIAIEEFGRIGFCNIRMWDEGSDIHLAITGVSRMVAVFEFLLIDQLAPTTYEEARPYLRVVKT